MAVITVDAMCFRIKEHRDFHWLQRYGTAFWVNDQTGSGCVCLGMQGQGERYFVKIAGVGTLEAEVSPEESVLALKSAMPLYKKLRHPHLIRLLEHYPVEELYVAVFDWAEGECLYDHWNFEKYAADPSLKSPRVRFKELPKLQKLKAAEVLFSFLKKVAAKGYVAVDFYDGSILYDFLADTVMLCDIDFFRKQPAVNDRGEGYWGTKRLKAPEEYALGAEIEECTNVYTLGALLFDLFGSYTKEEIAKRYRYNAFFPCTLDDWSLNRASYMVLRKATAFEKQERYQSVAQFHEAWVAALNKE